MKKIGQPPAFRGPEKTDAAIDTMRKHMQELVDKYHLAEITTTGERIVGGPRGTARQRRSRRKKSAMWSEIFHAVQVDLHLTQLFVILVGTVAGMVIGALPGLSAVSGVALLLPFTFSMEPAHGLIMLAAVYMAAEYGGSISAILINTPGTSGAACTILDGTPLTRQGKAQEALYISLFAGTIGGLTGVLVLLFFTPCWRARRCCSDRPRSSGSRSPASRLVATLSGRHAVKGLVGVVIGIALTLVGQDAITGDMRFMFNDYRLVGGIPLIPALLGLFAVASILGLLEGVNEPVAPLVLRKGAIRSVIARMAQMKRLLLWSSMLGTLVGVVPGAGASISAFVAYGEAKRLSKHPEDVRSTAPGKASPRRNRPTTRSSAAPSCRCWRSAFPDRAPPPSCSAR